MRPADQYDAEQAFASVDTDCDGRIDLASLVVLFLGLGFQPIDITKEDLQRAAGGAASVTFPETVQVLSKVRVGLFACLRICPCVHGFMILGARSVLSILLVLT